MDIMDGRIVKGVHFEGMRDAGDPVEAARRYCEQGADELWMLDIRASVEKRPTRLDMIRQVAKVCSVPLGVGGGIRTLDDVEAVVKAGATKVGIGSAALANPEIIRRASYKLGRECTVALVDAKAKGDGTYIVLGAGQTETDIELVAWAKQLCDLGAGSILLTTMQDGAQTGYDIEATRAVSGAVPVPVIASGGAGKLEDFLEAVTEGHASGVLAASVFHFGTLTIGQVKEYLADNGVAVHTGDFDFSMLRFDERGLIPAIAQDVATGRVLMQAYMNAESLRATLTSGYATYYSRSRQALWRKGETSGNTQRIREILYDCDGDCLLLKVVPAGPACHTGEETCFYRSLERMDGGRSTAVGSGILQDVYNVVLDRMANPKEGSYTNKLLTGGVDRIGKKVVEEAFETVLAAKNKDFAETRFETADLLYHLMVLLVEQGVALEDVYAELQNRR
jgi:imidazoleglycerol phosphate synthase cyclase subunit/phosphoribosyl-ATP pyrophosphohydrolase